MNRLTYIMFFFVLFVFCSSICNNTFAQNKPLLSEAIGKAIDTKGVKAAKKQFAEQFESKKEDFTVDMEGLTKLSQKYVNAGNYEAAGAVMAIASPYMQTAIMSGMDKQTNNMIKKLESRRKQEERKKKKEHAKEQQKQKDNIVLSNGKARQDLERFTGLYGDPEGKNKLRKLWVMASCDGYLVVGATWGDGASWWMKSVSDNSFSYSDSFSKLNISFETDGDGKAVKMIHDLNFIKTPLVRMGPTPDEWGPCVERPKR